MEQKQQQQGYTCTGDCLRCHPGQRQYCAAQFTYNSMRMIERLNEKVDTLTAKVEAIQGSEEMLFNPKETAQDGAGAEE